MNHSWVGFSFLQPLRAWETETHFSGGSGGEGPPGKLKSPPLAKPKGEISVYPARSAGGNFSLPRAKRGISVYPARSGGGDFSLPRDARGEISVYLGAWEFQFTSECSDTRYIFSLPRRQWAFQFTSGARYIFSSPLTQYRFSVYLGESENFSLPQTQDRIPVYRHEMEFQFTVAEFQFTFDTRYFSLPWQREFEFTFDSRYNFGLPWQKRISI